MNKPSPFKSWSSAVAHMPLSIIGNFDPLQHTSFSDCAYCAQHELDMYEEGEETDIKSEREAKRVRTYLARCKASMLTGQRA